MDIIYNAILNFNLIDIVLYSIILVAAIMILGYCLIDLYDDGYRGRRMYLYALAGAFISAEFMLISYVFGEITSEIEFLNTNKSYIIRTLADLKNELRTNDVNFGSFKATDMIFVLNLVLIFIVLYFAIRQVYKSDDTYISIKSVAHAMDYLPLGILYYTADGKVIFANKSINELYEGITGHSLINANEFMESVKAGNFLDAVDTGGDGDIVVKKNDNEYLAFDIKENVISNKPVSEVNVYDVTDEYLLYEKIKQDYENEKTLNERLGEHGKTIRKLVMDNEILNAKARLHSDLGLVLITTKQFLQNGATKDEWQDLIFMWKRTINLLSGDWKNDDINNADDELHDVIYAASVIGVSVNIIGKFPDSDSKNFDIFVKAIHECVTNGVRHAGCTNIYVRIIGEKKMEIKNDGKVPEGDIIERGGLLDLRSQVEERGGKMSISKYPEFLLIIEM